MSEFDEVLVKICKLIRLHEYYPHQYKSVPVAAGLARGLKRAINRASCRE